MRIKRTESDKSIALLEKITGQRLTINNCIWAIRKCKEMTSVEFAEKLGISRQCLCDIEHNRRRISPEMAARFAKKLGHSEEQFIRLAFQAELDKLGLPFHVGIERAA